MSDLMSSVRSRDHQHLVDELEPRLRDRIVEQPHGCWNWIGSRTSKGYGTAHFDGHTTTAHRLVFAALVGPIPPGHHIDHVGCRNTGCVNPAHLEAVTPQVNRRRQVMLRGTNHYNGAKRRCPAGHPYNGKNLVVYVDRDGVAHRRCATCMRARRRAQLTAVDVAIGQPIYERARVVR